MRVKLLDMWLVFCFEDDNIDLTNTTEIDGWWPFFPWPTQYSTTNEMKAKQIFFSQRTSLQNVLGLKPQQKSISSSPIKPIIPERVTWKLKMLDPPQKKVLFGLQ